MQRILPFLLLILVLMGCGGRQTPLAAESVAGLEAQGVAVELAEADMAAFVQELNQAKCRRRVSSGVATHRLVLITAEGARYTMHRIDQEKVEVGLRHGDLRRKFFLISPALSEMVARICEGKALEAGP